MRRVISISLSPNVFIEDIAAAKAMRQIPEVWRTGEAIQTLERDVIKYFDIASDYRIYTVNSGRSALFSILRAFGVGKGDEVLLQAFTCNAVPNPVLWLDAKPVYVDVNEDTFNMNVDDLERKITPRAKAIIVQHTFGLAADLDAILAIASRHHLYVIEDCAHALGGAYKGRKLGTFGDAAFFSFGRDKVISCVYGGIALLKNEQTSAVKNMDYFYDALPFPSRRWIRQQLRHPIAMDLITCWYNAPFSNYGIGKFMLRWFQVSNVLSKAVHWKEKQGQKPDYFPRRLPNALAFLAVKQFRRLDAFNAHRRKLAEFYHSSLTHNSSFIIAPLVDGHVYLRFSVRHKKAHHIIREARKRGMLLGDWYDSAIAPRDTQLRTMLYNVDSCPVAERLTRETFNLPTNPNLSMEEAKRIMTFLKTIDK